MRSHLLTTPDGNLVSHAQVEIVILSIGLAMHDLWMNQFSETPESILAHVSDTPLEFHEYEQLSHHAEDLLKGFENL